MESLIYPHKDVYDGQFSLSIWLVIQSKTNLGVAIKIFCRYDYSP